MQSRFELVLLLGVLLGGDDVVVESLGLFEQRLQLIHEVRFLPCKTCLLFTLYVGPRKTDASARRTVGDLSASVQLLSELWDGEVRGVVFQKVSEQRRVPVRCETRVKKKIAMHRGARERRRRGREEGGWGEPSYRPCSPRCPNRGEPERASEPGVDSGRKAAHCCVRWQRVEQERCSHLHVFKWIEYRDSCPPDRGATKVLVLVMGCVGAESEGLDLLLARRTRNVATFHQVDYDLKEHGWQRQLHPHGPPDRRVGRVRARVHASVRACGRKGGRTGCTG
jgi:hypothetical protein